MKSINLNLTIDRPVSQARARVLDLASPLLRGFTERRNADAVEYRPKVAMPVVLWAVRRLQGEHVTFTFDQRGAAVTEVRATGRLRNRAHAELTEALGGS